MKGKIPGVDSRVATQKKSQWASFSFWFGAVFIVLAEIAIALAHDTPTCLGSLLLNPLVWIGLGFMYAGRAPARARARPRKDGWSRAILIWAILCALSIPCLAGILLLQGFAR